MGSLPRPDTPPIPTQLPLFAAQFPVDDAQFVRLGAGSRIPAGPWRDERPDYPAMLEHVEGGGNAGVVPGTARWRDLPLAVLDVDHGRAEALTTAYPPVAAAPTARGSHVWYFAAEDAPAVNAQWSGPGGTGGDYRALHGYAALHGEELATVDAGLASIASARRGFGVGDLPVNLLEEAGSGPRAEGGGSTCPARSRPRPRPRTPRRARSSAPWWASATPPSSRSSAAGVAGEAGTVAPSPRGGSQRGRRRTGWRCRRAAPSRSSRWPASSRLSCRSDATGCLARTRTAGGRSRQSAAGGRDRRASGRRHAGREKHPGPWPASAARRGIAAPRPAGAASATSRSSGCMPPVTLCPTSPS